jgi:type IV pilus assembly protein PilC
MEFRCRLGTTTGEIVEGVYAAESEARLRRELEDRGLYVLEIRPKSRLPRLTLAWAARRRLPLGDFLIFNQELATLLRAGMPLVQSLDILRQRVGHQGFRAVLDDVYERVRAGSALSEAFEAQGDLVPRVYTASLYAGEKSGSLEQVLRRYVAHVRLLATVRRRTLSALIYPSILLGLSLLVVGIIVFRVVPEFGEFYASFDARLPVATRLLVETSRGLRSAAPLLVLLVVGSAVGGYVWAQQPAARARVDRWLLALPGVGSLARRYATSQMARTLATLLGGGIPLVQALETTARSIGNRYVARQLQAVERQVREGQSLAAAMEAQRVFPDVAIKMVEVGESTGALQEMLNSVADFYDEELDTVLGRLVTLVEPLLLVVMGLVIASLLLALYLPLLQLSSVLG